MNLCLQSYTFATIYPIFTSLDPNPKMPEYVSNLDMDPQHCCYTLKTFKKWISSLNNLTNWWIPVLDPSNINILETPTTPDGKRCPQYWESFGDSCYLLRNQVHITVHSNQVHVIL